MGQDVYSVADVAKIIHVSIATVNRLLNSGKLKGYQPSENAKWKIPRKELLRYMREHNIPIEFLEGERTRILVIDDETSISDIIKMVFQEDRDVEIDSAYSGFQAGLKLESFRPDIILLDIYLGDMDGRELLQHIRNHPELHGARIIGISGMMSGQELDKMLMAGFDAFIQKPFQLNALKETVREFKAQLLKNA